MILTDDMVARIEKLARARVPERLVTFYTARRGTEVLGYAAIHAHIVRTKQETLALVFEPDGRLRKISVLAFLEPPEYRPPDRWSIRQRNARPKARASCRAANRWARRSHRRDLRAEHRGTNSTRCLAPKAVATRRSGGAGPRRAGEHLGELQASGRTLP